MSSLAALGFSQIVSAPTHQARHTLNLIFAAGLSIHLETIDVVSWLYHFVLKVFHHHHPLDGKQVYVSLQMGKIGFQRALQDPTPASGSLDELVGDCNSCLFDAINITLPNAL